MKRTRKVARKASDSIQDDISAIAEDLTSLGKAVGETASAEVKATIKSLRQRCDSLAGHADSLLNEGIEDARGMIAENPFISVAVAFGLGFVVAGMLVRR